MPQTVRVNFYNCGSEYLYGNICIMLPRLNNEGCTKSHGLFFVTWGYLFGNKNSPLTFTCSTSAFGFSTGDHHPPKGQGRRAPRMKRSSGDDVQDLQRSPPPRGGQEDHSGGRPDRPSQGRRPYPDDRPHDIPGDGHGGRPVRGHRGGRPEGRGDRTGPRIFTCQPVRVNPLCTEFG